MAETLEVTREGAVAVVEFHNPPLNLLTTRLRNLLNDAATDIAADPSLRAVILRGAGDRAFSAGSNIREFPVDALAGAARAAQEHRCYNAIATLPQPVLAQLHGHVLGGGLELALACDLRIADESVRLGLPEVLRGVFPSGSGTQRLPRTIAPSRAKQMMFLGETIGAATALSVGLVDQVVPAAAAPDEALAQATRIAEQPRLAVQAIKKAVNHGLAFGAAAGEAMERELIAELFTSHDAQEGVESFLESRSPKFNHT